jgi:CBS-domain-containing membrane protein
MTDLKFVPAATVLGDADIEAASQLMIARGVRLLLVVSAERDVTGLVTARDLLGDKPGDVMNERHVQHDQVLVKDIMTPREQIEVLDLGEVLHARVGDVVATLKGSGRQHAVVVDHEPLSNKTLIRGIFSASQIARQLGIPVNAGEMARTFSELDALLKSI